MLTIDSLTLAYGDKPVLRDVSLPVLPTGALVGVLGPNGSGKSTLLRALAGLMAHDGQVLLDTEPLSGMDRAQRVRRIGYLPQDLPQASSLVGYEAVMSACRAVRTDWSRREVEKACARIFEHLDLMPLAFRPLGRLSGGERQMIGLAQVMVRDPRLFLLDEPTSALDLKRQVAVLSAVRSAVRASDGLCLAALHDINLALRHCDLIALLSHGSLIAFGPAEGTLTPALLRRAYGIEGRIETCSRGRPLVIVDAVTDAPAAMARASQS